jgi:hypothetical protein
LIAKSCLIHHPDTADAAIKALYIGVKAHFQNGELWLYYDLVGALGNLLIPEPQKPSETDELWQHTCFEAFIAVEEDEVYPYHEFNFSPSGHWAAYAFGDYRERKQWRAQSAPAINCMRSQEGLSIKTVIKEADLPHNPLNRPYRLGLSAVLETKQNELSYWALFHPSGKPDFHHRSGFTLSFNLGWR